VWNEFFLILSRDWLLLVLFLLLLGLIVFIAHKDSQKSEGVEVVQTGASLFVTKSCLACHRKNSSTSCPSLINFAEKPLIVGKVPNTPENLRKWLKNPTSIKKGSRMPNLGLADEEIELLVEYIQTL
jgi:cytochrome c oxidase subunit 2